VISRLSYQQINTNSLLVRPLFTLVKFDLKEEIARSIKQSLFIENNVPYQIHKGRLSILDDFSHIMRLLRQRKHSANPYRLPNEDLINGISMMLL
jgi:hypothetical protein